MGTWEAGGRRVPRSTRECLEKGESPGVKKNTPERVRRGRTGFPVLVYPCPIKDSLQWNSGGTTPTPKQKTTQHHKTQSRPKRKLRGECEDGDPRTLSRSRGIQTPREGCSPRRAGEMLGSFCLLMRKQSLLSYVFIGLQCTHREMSGRDHLTL